MSEKTHHHRVSLAGKDLDGVHGAWLRVLSVDLNDGHRMLVDREREVGVARDGNNTKAVTAEDVGLILSMNNQ